MICRRLGDGKLLGNMVARTCARASPRPSTPSPGHGHAADAALLATRYGRPDLTPEETVAIQSVLIDTGGGRRSKGPSRC